MPGNMTSKTTLEDRSLHKIMEQTMIQGGSGEPAVVIQNNFDADFQAAVEAQGMRVIPVSRLNYMSKLNTMKKYLRLVTTHGCVDSDDNIVVPLPKDVVIGLFGWLMKNSSLAKPRRRAGFVANVAADTNDHLNQITVSKDTMQGYISALKWYYKEKSKIMDADTVQALSMFVAGYKKIVAKKKKDGVMDEQVFFNYEMHIK